MGRSYTALWTRIVRLGDGSGGLSDDMEARVIMMKFTRVLAVLAAAVLLASAGGCVLKSTHDKALAELGDARDDLQKTKTELAATQMAKEDLQSRYTQSQD